MQHTNSLNTHLSQIALADGCQLTVLQAAETQQCALALSFAAGSHDEPSEYLGTAHFLEHLVFRGSRNYAVDDGLMAFVQRHGGQVNAQTQAQQTLFHFQVESSLFIGAIERLVDMLVAPRLDEAMLRSEREVLNEEFLLYCQAPQVLLDAALAVSLLDAHPLQRFYAGNRQTLRIDDARFSAALSAFHRASYLRSKLKIVLVIPQAWSHWQAQVLAALQPLTREHRDRSVSPLPRLQLSDSRTIKLKLPVAEHYFVLHVPINTCAQGLPELAEKMQHALALRMGQTFMSYAEQQGWCSAIAVRAPYVAQTQGVLSIQFKQLSAVVGELLPTFRAWLEQWRAQLHSTEQQAYELQAQLHRWSSADPLRKAQQVLSGLWPLQGVSLECLAALDCVIEALHSNAFVQVNAGPEQVSGFYDGGLPLNIELVKQVSSDIIKPHAAVAVPFCMSSTVSAGNTCKQDAAQGVFGCALAQYHPLGFPKDRAVCYWGWSVASPQDVAQRLQARLAPFVEQFSYNAVHWQIEILPADVFIRITGPVSYLANAVNQILAALEHPLAAAPFVSNSPFALRRLLQRLPAMLASANSPVVAAETVLAYQPQSALWLGEPTGLGQLDPLYVQRLKILAAVTEAQSSTSGWHQVSDSRTDDALLIVHMPLSAMAMVEKDLLRVINKVFAQHFQSFLQRRLRDELGLCYAVFVMPHTQVSREGLVCAVQSSKVDASRLLEEIRQCLVGFQALLTEHLSILHTDALLQAEQLEQGTQSLEFVSQMLFRHWREQRLTLGLREEIQAIRLIKYADFEKYYQAIQDSNRWFVLSNQSSD